MKCGSPERIMVKLGEGWTSRREEYTRAFGVAEDPAWTGEVEFTTVRNEQIST